MAATRKTKALLVIRNDAIVCEWYAPDFAVDQKHGTASLAKAIVGGLSLAVAMSDGRITLDDPAAKFIPLPIGTDIENALFRKGPQGSFDAFNPHIEHMIVRGMQHGKSFVFMPRENTKLLPGAAFDRGALIADDLFF